MPQIILSGRVRRRSPDADAQVHFAQGKYPFPVKTPVVPASDAAGTVIATGKKAQRFKPGNKVCTLFNQSHLAGSPNLQTISSGLGGALDGTLRQYGVFDEAGLVSMPNNLTMVEASTLSCAALTAWNALYGLTGKELKPGETVLTQGTGGVSIFALQFARAAGATVIATTGSAAKADKLKRLGAHHVINYKENPNWGQTVKQLTGEGGTRGVDHILEVSGPSSIAQSLEAIKIDGVITIIGFLGGRGGGTDKEQPGFLDCLTRHCVVRGIFVGSRLLFEDMNRAIEASNIKPVLDEQVFSFDQVPHAYQYMWEQKHFGKLVVKID